MRCKPPEVRPIDLGILREDYAFTPDLDELAAGLAIWSHPTRLRIFALLDQVQQMCVCDLAEVLGISVSAVSQNLAKMRAQRLVKFRRDAQTLYYALTDHPINAHIRRAVNEARDQVGASE
ncbi:MAG: winged helix-turn-helix transcriptional regulator [Oligoflexia bacterium]|nr:winged helix-turn-helix transcriptional regulator [Oligoflexia bacterium]